MASNIRSQIKKLAEISELLIENPDDTKLLVKKLEFLSMLSKSSPSVAKDGIEFVQSISPEQRKDLKVSSHVICVLVETQSMDLFRDELRFIEDSFPKARLENFVVTLREKLSRNPAHRHFLGVLNQHFPLDNNSSKAAKESSEDLVAAFEKALVSNDVSGAKAAFTKLAKVDQRQHRMAYRLAILLRENNDLPMSNIALEYALQSQAKNVNYLKMRSEILFALDPQQWVTFYKGLKGKIDISPEMQVLLIMADQPNIKEGDASEIHIPVSTDVEPVSANSSATSLANSASTEVSRKGEPRPLTVKEKFRAELLRIDVKSYKPIIESYVKEGQFKARWNVTDKTSIELIENKLAIDLKYLDMRIREIILPYLIKIEVYIRQLYKDHIDPSDSNSEILKKISPHIGDEFTIIFDDTKIQGIENIKMPRREFRTILVIIFSQIRNFLMHGNRNFFNFHLSLKFQTKLKRSILQASNNTNDFWKQIDEVDDIDSIDFDEVRSELQSSASESETLNEFFEIKILSDIMTPAAKKRQKIFGVLILLLYLSNESTFVGIASAIDRCILDFYATTQFGTKANLYEALGLSADWLVKMIAHHINK